MFRARLFVGTPESFVGPPGGYAKWEAETWEELLLLLGVVPEKQDEIKGTLIPVGPVEYSSILNSNIPTDVPLVWAIDTIC